MAHRVGLLRRTDSVAIEGIADIRRSLAARRSDANDPKPTDIDRTEMPQRSSLLLYAEVVLSFLSKEREALGSETPRVHHPARRRGGVAALGAGAAVAADEADRRTYVISRERR